MTTLRARLIKGWDADRAIVAPPTRPAWDSQGSRADIARRYADGGTIRGIAESVGADRETIAGIISGQGGTIRGRGKPLSPVRDDAFDAIDEASAYWIGFLMADGNIDDTPGQTPRVRLSLQPRDAGHVEAFRVFLGSTLQARHMGHLVTLSVASARLVDSLACYGVIPRKTKIARVVGLESNRDFWRGVVDGDGCLTWCGRSPRLNVTGSAGIVGQFVDFIRKFCPDYRGSSRPVHDSFSVTLSSGRARTMVSVLYRDCRIALPRKLERARRITMGLGRD
jgi:hypothetical protein